jgi:predicted RecB family endonuclease
MPVVEKFPALLRDDLEAAFEEDLDSVFDVVQARRALEQQRIELELEMKKVYNSQIIFDAHIKYVAC